MHILHALFTPFLGGLEQAYLNTTEALAAKGHRVTALIRDDAPYKEQATRLAHSTLTLSPTGFYDLATAWKARTLLRRLKPDMIIAHNSRAVALMRWAERGSRIPLCAVSHSYKTARMMHADSLVVLTEHMQAHFQNAGYPPERLHIIPNLIHLPGEPSLTPQGKPVVIGALGRFAPDKGFDVLLRALQILMANGVDFKAHIAGDGVEAASLRALATELGLGAHLTWEGWVSDTADFYRKLDLFCLPSLEESFGLVVIEAMAHGVPVVATSVSGPLSIIHDQRSGLLVKPGDAEALAHALSELCNDSAKAAQLAKNGWGRVQDFGFEAVADKWDGLVKAIITTPSSP